MKKYKVTTNMLNGFKNGDIITDNTIQDVINRNPDWFEEIKEDWHWPGRFNPKEITTICVPESFVRLSLRSDMRTIYKEARLLGSCCKDIKETEFIERKQKAYLEVIDLLKELNDGWRPDWGGDDNRYECFYNHSSDTIDFFDCKCSQTSLAELIAKTKEIWYQVIEQLGKDKVKLALWGIE